MTRYLTHDLIDKERWDDCIRNALNGLIFGNSWLLDVAYPQWAGVVLGDYEAVLMIPVKRRFGIIYALQPFFVRHSGIYSRRELSAEEVKAMLQIIPGTLKWIKLYAFPVQQLPGAHWTITPRYFQRMALQNTYEGLSSFFSTNTKRNLKKAGKHGLQLGMTEDTSVVPELFRRFKGGELEIFSDEDYLTLEAVMRACNEKDHGETYQVTDPHGNILAAAFFCRFGSTLTFLKGAASNEGKSTGAMHFLFCHVIAKYAGKLDFLDFGGSNIESVARFYHGFGGRDVEYHLLEKDKLPKVVKIVREIKRKRRA